MNFKEFREKFNTAVAADCQVEEARLTKESLALIGREAVCGIIARPDVMTAEFAWGKLSESIRDNDEIIPYFYGGTARGVAVTRDIQPRDNNQWVSE